MTDEPPIERRRVQRDWLGHTLYAVGIVIAMFVGLGLPILYWGSGVNSALAILTDHDRTNTTSITTATSQLIDVNKALATLTVQMQDIRDSIKAREKK